MEHIRRWGHHILLRADPEAADRLWGIGRDAVPRLLEHLGDVRIPVLLVAGSADPLSPPAAMAELQRLLAHTRLVEVEGAGHVPIMTRPQTIAAAIDDYFTPDGTL